MKHNFSNSFFVLFVVVAGFLACQSNPYEVDTYFKKSEKDTLLANIITYASQYARGATNATRFEPRFRKEYVSRLGQYWFEGYFVAPDSTHYFFINRPVGSGYFRRGTGGKFKLKAGSLMPVQYEEIWCTPHFKGDSLVKERGGFLFRAMTKEGNIDKYLPMKLYVEWPDARLVYDKKINEWVTIDR